MSLFGPKVLLEGPAGVGKTHSIGTLVDWAASHSRPVTVIFTENSLETLKGYWVDKGKPIPPNLSWSVITAPTLTLDSLIDAAGKAGQLSYEALTKAVDGSRYLNNTWQKFLVGLRDIKDDRTGKSVGGIQSMTEESILVVDSLSEAARACFRMTIGNKMVASPSEYLIAQNNLINWVVMMTQSFPGTFVLTAHVQRIINEVSGQTQLMTKAIGKALGDEFPQLFSEAIYAVRQGTEFFWDTASLNVDTKVRSLPISSKIRPDFAQIMDVWEKRRKAG